MLRRIRCSLPLTVGPGSISAAITLRANAAHHHAYHPLTSLAALLGLVLIAIRILLCYGFGDRLVGIPGPTGMTVITQLSSFFLVCIGVQIAWNGVKAAAGIGDVAYWLPCPMPAISVYNPYI
jgi:multiple antibiotic resistance protein